MTQLSEVFILFAGGLLLKCSAEMVQLLSLKSHLNPYSAAASQLFPQTLWEFWERCPFVSAEMVKSLFWHFCVCVEFKLK